MRGTGRREGIEAQVAEKKKRERENGSQGAWIRSHLSLLQSRTRYALTGSLVL